MLSHVVCDWCDKDFTESNECGGILFGSYATCPDCVPRIESSAKRECEEHLIRGRCPEGKPFAQWVREDLRHPDDDGQMRVFSLEFGE